MISSHGGKHLRAFGQIWPFAAAGDFNGSAITQELEADCISSGIVANAGFNIGGSDASGANGRCALTLPPGTTYYVNMLFTGDDPAITPSEDPTWSCGVGDPNDCGMQMQLVSVSGWGM